MAEDSDMTAGELALGVLEGEARAAALRRVLADPAFAREVEAWRERLAALHGDWPEVEPGPDLARRVTAIPDGGRSGDDAARWRWATALAGAAAAVLLGVVALRHAPAPIAPAPVIRVAPSLVVVLTPENGKAFAALFDPVTREVRLAGAVAVPADRVAELWAIGGDGVPHAAGLLSRGGGRLAVKRDLGVAAGTTFAISIEPVGGSPKPVPTGPVIATGKLSAI